MRQRCGYWQLPGPQQQRFKVGDRWHYDVVNCKKRGHGERSEGITTTYDGKKLQVEKAILEISGRPDTQDFAQMIVDLLNKNEGLLERNEEEEYTLEDLDDPETLKTAVWLAHSQFQGVNSARRRVGYSYLLYRVRRGRESSDCREDEDSLFCYTFRFL